MKSFGVRTAEQLFIDRLHPEKQPFKDTPEFLQWLVPLIPELRNLSELRTRLTYQDFVEQFAIEFDEKAVLSEDLTVKRYINKFDLRKAYEALKKEHSMFHEPRADAQKSLGIERTVAATR